MKGLEIPKSTALPTSRRDDLVTVALATWLIAGLLIDGYAHSNIIEDEESFFTIWHAVFYSGFLATTGWVFLLIRRNLKPGRSWLQAIPPGYHTAAVGIVVFAVGGIGDGIWHTLLGVETSLDALLSPTHLLLFMGGLMIVTSPYLATLQRGRMERPEWSVFLVPFLSILLATSLVAFFFAYLWGPAETSWYKAVYNPATNFGEFTVAGGIAAMLTAVIISTTPLVLILRRWHPPAGTFTILWGFLGLFIAIVFDRDSIAFAAGLAGGLAADLLVGWLDAGSHRPMATRVVAFTAPIVLASAFFLILRSEVRWQAELWGGAIFFSGLAGLALDLLVGKRESVVPQPSREAD